MSRSAQWISAVLWMSGGVLALLPTACAQEFLDVVVTPRFFSSPEAHPTLQARTRSAMTVDVIVYEAGGRPVAYYPGGGDPGMNHEVALKSLPPADRGLYLFHLIGRDASGERRAEYPEAPEGGDFLEVSDCRWVPEDQRIEYLLPKAACIRIRAGLTDGAYLEEVLPWQTQPAGRHAIQWTSATNNPVLLEMSRRPDFQARVLALTLPANLVSDTRLRSERFAGSATPDVALPERHADRTTLPGGSLFSNVRKRSQITIADDYKLTLTVTEASGPSVVQLRLDCDESDRARLLNQRFEVMIFLDGLFLTEDELAILPFNYRMSTRGLAPGQHVATMNVLDSRGVPGTASALFQVTSKSRIEK